MSSIKIIEPVIYEQFSIRSSIKPMCVQLKAKYNYCAGRKIVLLQYAKPVFLKGAYFLRVCNCSNRPL